MAKVGARLPWHVQFVSLVFIIGGLIDAVFRLAALFGYGGAKVSIGSAATWLNLITSVALIVIGVGLRRHKRWAWVAGMILFALSLAWALALIASTSAARAYVFWFAVIPSALVLWSLAAPRTRRDFLDR
jgi:hypothetical protein